MKRLLLCVFAFLGCATTPDGEAGGVLLEATRTRTPPAIDGRIDPVWESAKPLTVVIREAIGGGAPRKVVLRALYTHDRFYILAQWPDATRSDMRDPYVWDPVRKKYDRPSRPDDQFALEFPLTGDFRVDMLTTEAEFVADVWHWKAGRGNPVGWVDDKRHRIRKKPGKKTRAYELGGRATVYIARLMDQGEPAYTVKDEPASFVGNVVDSFTPRQPSGSLADVRGKAIHDGSGWTLEMARKLNTGHADDAVVYADNDTPCAFAVLDDELYWHHSVSGLLLLRLVPR